MVPYIIFFASFNCAAMICESTNYEAKLIMMTKNFQEKSTYFRRWYKWCASR